MLTKDEIQTLFHILYNNEVGDDIEFALAIIKNNKHHFHPWQIIALMLLSKSPHIDNKWERIVEIYNIKKWIDAIDFDSGWIGENNKYWKEIIHETNGDYDKVEYALYHHFLFKIQQLTDHFTSIRIYVN